MLSNFLAVSTTQARAISCLDQTSKMTQMSTNVAKEIATAMNLRTLTLSLLSITIYVPDQVRKRLRPRRHQPPSPQIRRHSLKPPINAQLSIRHLRDQLFPDRPVKPERRHEQGNTVSRILILVQTEIISQTGSGDEIDDYGVGCCFL